MLGSLKLTVREIRAEMGLSQSELAALAGISSRAVQSYEQEWRQPSGLAERTLLLLLLAHRHRRRLLRFRCWERKQCAAAVRAKCIAYVTRQGHLCWFLTGTTCEGRRQKCWGDKLHSCLDCGFMHELLTPIEAGTE